MTDLPRFGQYAPVPRKEPCPRHPAVSAVDYCKRCNRPTCVDCTIPTEVGSVCVDCAKPGARRPRLSSGTPVVTYVLIGVTLLSFLVGKVWSPLNAYLAFNPIYAHAEPWRFVTVNLTHAGFFHILFNMLMLYFLGAGGERILGHWRFLSLYALSTIGGSVAVLAWALVEPSSLTTWTVGASGAIYGLFGAVLVQQLLSRINPTSILVLLGINLAYSFMVGGISWQGHVGGLIVGALMAWLYAVLSKPQPGRTQRTQSMWEIMATVAVVLVLAGTSFGIYSALGA